jgi:hydroxymethylpyrimidine pyrophosphatase-like HAD family hydrolase
MVVTDFDGTLLNRDGVVDKPNIDTLVYLGNKGIVRTIATGRSPYSIGRVISGDFPVDYIVFSSGAGIIRWSDKQIIHQRHLTETETQIVISELLALGVDFMVHDPIPHNHRFLYHSHSSDNPDFFRRIEVYNAYCSPYISGIEFPNGATQLIAVLPNDPELFALLSVKFPGLKVIRTTSPLDGSSIWMEVFPKEVSKAYGVSWLCNQEVHCGIKDVVSIGNDFNDLDMLDLTDVSYVVANAPFELKDRYRVVPSNDEHGFSVAVMDALAIHQ